MRKTKIVCTIGPVSSSPDTLREMILAGMDVARLNFSHGTWPDHEKNFRNVRDIAAELGHVSVRYDGPVCNCGSRGCVETYASATGVVRRAREALASGAQSALADGAPTALADVADEDQCAHVFALAAQGDPLAQTLVADTIVCLATAMGSLINIFNPDMIVLFGGMTNAGDQLLVPLRDEVRRRCFQIGADRCQIVRSRLGAEAGVIGAAVTAMQAIDEQQSSTTSD